MRFLSLSLDAFGPFSGERLDLSGGSPGGLHLIYGPNEAGKSTSLRAVSALLFGMPQRSVDAHLHPSAELRVGAVLEHEGRVLCVTRLKRRRDSLVGEDGEPLDDAVLVPFLGGIDQRSFEARFGLDQTVLEEGARALLGGSEEGIFSAGTAGAQAGRVLGQLTEELDALFRPRGQKYPLNAELMRLQDAEKALRIAERPPEKYAAQRQASEAAQARVHALLAEQHRVRRELGRLSRHAAVLTDVSAWLQTDRELSDLSGVPLLPPDSTERRHAMLAAQREVEIELATHQQELGRLEALREGLSPDQALLGVDEERLALVSNQIGSELKARADLPKRRGKLAALGEELARLRRQLRRSDVEADELLIDAPLERRVRSLAAEHGRLVTEVQQLERNLTRLLSEMRAVEADVGELAQPSTAERVSELTPAALGAEVGLELTRALLLQVRTARDEEKRVSVLRATLLELRCEVERLEKELPPVVGPAEAPDPAQLEAVLEDLSRNQRHIEELELRIEHQRTEQARAEAHARSVRDTFDIPTEQDLRSLRGHRDELLRGIQADPSAVSGELLTRLETGIREADEISDRLRREAQRVAELQKHAAAALDAATDAERARTELAQQAIARARAEANYREVFRSAGVEAPPLHAARVVARRLGQCASARQGLLRADAELGEIRARLETARARVASHLGLETADLSLAAAEEILDKRIEQERKIELERAASRGTKQRLEVRWEEENQAFARARAALDTWQGRWAEAMLALGQSEDASPEEVELYLASLAELTRVVEEMREMRRRVDGIERDTKTFTELVSGIARRSAPDLLGRDPVEMAEEILSRVREAKTTSRERERLGVEIDARAQAVSQARMRSQSVAAELEARLREANVATLEELALMEEKSARKRVLLGRLSSLEATLQARSGGVGLRELVSEVQGLDHDDLQASIAHFESRQEEVDDELNSARREALELSRGLEIYSSLEAATARQRVAERRAATLHVLREYLVKKAAQVLLGEQVRRYAESHQGPILARADGFFRRLTLGKYSGLRVGLGERVLRCVRDGKDVEVEGLSRGTRAQLYLALRLASLERHFEANQKIPLVLDDLFVDFDDDRTAAAFELLGELSRVTQILYYTHLARDVEAADAAVTKESLFLHKLGIS